MRKEAEESDSDHKSDETVERKHSVEDEREIVPIMTNQDYLLALLMQIATSDGFGPYIKVNTLDSINLSAQAPMC